MAEQTSMKNREHPLYSAFAGMKDRCYNKRHKSYHRYGGRGITVCDRWLVRGSGFWNFVEDMGQRPKGHSLDRVDNNGPYSPDNCRWATRKEQTANAQLARGERHGHSKLNAQSVLLVKALLSEGWSTRQVGARFNISRQSIADIKAGRTWRHVT